ncbi:DNA-binding protein [Streptococcus pneumoniae]|nr:DNA-binding protein [Streptococcus pneumoniae]
MNILSEEFESGIRMVVKDQFKESFIEFLERESDGRGWLSISKAAHHACVSDNTIRKWLKEGLNLYQIDGTKRIKKSELDEYIESHLVI